VLGDEDRVVPHGRLPAVVGGLGGGQALLDEIASMGKDYVQAFFPQARRFPRPQSKAPAEFGALQRFE
jgi:hypothetical protein